MYRLLTLTALLLIGSISAQVVIEPAFAAKRRDRNDKRRRDKLRRDRLKRLQQKAGNEQKSDLPGPTDIPKHTAKGSGRRRSEAEPTARKTKRREVTTLGDYEPHFAVARDSFYVKGLGPVENQLSDNDPPPDRIIGGLLGNMGEVVGDEPSRVTHPELNRILPLIYADLHQAQREAYEAERTLPADKSRLTAQNNLRVANFLLSLGGGGFLPNNPRAFIRHELNSDVYHAIGKTTRGNLTAYRLGLAKWIQATANRFNHGNAQLKHALSNLDRLADQAKRGDRDVLNEVAQLGRQLGDRFTQELGMAESTVQAQNESLMLLGVSMGLGLKQPQGLSQSDTLEIIGPMAKAFDARTETQNLYKTFGRVMGRYGQLVDNIDGKNN